MRFFASGFVLPVYGVMTMNRYENSVLCEDENKTSAMRHTRGKKKLTNNQVLAAVDAGQVQVHPWGIPMQ